MIIDRIVFRTLIVNFIILSTLLAQSPDLIVSSGNFSPSLLDRGSMLTIDATVNNAGGSSAGSSHLTFYISSTPTITDGYLLGSVSVEPLGAGISSENKEFTIPVPSYIYPGTYYIGWEADAYGEVAESDENNGFYLPSNQLTITYGLIISQHIPYPIIFIHGLASDDRTWDSLSTFLIGLGWSNGGRMDFCLNEDSDLTTGQLSRDYRDFTNEAGLQAADFYFVNFDVNPDGSVYGNSVQSNESAIVKQGVAIHDAIKHVLNITKRDKVILACHSMGGLAAREYLQNYSNWQTDGQHHVAKLLTIGTPHGGSDAWTFGSVHGYSEAVRDLRTTYACADSGVYLFGGNENTITGCITTFNNTDVNCNGYSGDDIIGVNHKFIPTDLSYSCIIGTASGGGDGVVSAEKANINNFPYNLNADTFKTNAWHSKPVAQALGTGEGYELQKLDAIMKGLDEPTYFDQSYEIRFDSLYFGVITSQSKGSLIYPDTTDYDDYKFTLNSSGMAHITVKDIPTSIFKIEVFDSLYNSRMSRTSRNLSQIDTLIQLTVGKYYFEISGMADTYSWEFPYAFKIGFTPTTSVENVTSQLPSSYVLFQNYPNPFNPTTTIRYELPEQSLVSLKVFNILGQHIATLVNETQSAGSKLTKFNANTLSNGVYYYTLSAVNSRNSFTQTHKMLLAK